MDQETVATYNRGAEHFAAEFDGIGPRTADIEQAFSMIGKPNPKVVELGCGNGRDAREILKRTDDYTGVDVSSRLLDIARAVNPNADFVEADMEEYEFPVGVDIIFAFASLLHSDRYQLAQVIRRAYQAMNSGGIFFLSLKEDHYHCEIKTGKVGPRRFYYYTPRDIRLISPMGLRVAYQDRQRLRDQDWFTLILQKTS